MEKPEKFREAGNVQFAKMSLAAPPFLRKRKYKGRKAEGIRYERKVQEHLSFEYPESYLPSPWFQFKKEGTDRFLWCQPDGIIIEIKHSHTSDAWWQTRRLYMPVMAVAFDQELWTIQVCEVVRWYDAATAFPEPIELASEPNRPSSKFKVHICRP
jgi:hypothetical protein